MIKRLLIALICLSCVACSNITTDSDMKYFDDAQDQETITSNERQEIEECIQLYFKSLEEKDFTYAYEIEFSKICTFEEYEDFWIRICDYIKLISIEGYMVTENENGNEDFIFGLPSDVETCYFKVLFELDYTEEGHDLVQIGPYFSGIKDEAGNWKLKPFGTSP